MQHIANSSQIQLLVGCCISKNCFHKKKTFKHNLIVNAGLNTHSHTLYTLMLFLTVNFRATLNYHSTYQQPWRSFGN